ncbi:MAG: EF-hand domain-containing protein, partial [Paracoccaceae bacterium]
MNRMFLFAAATLGLVGAQAMAQTLPEIADADGNGMWSLTELQVAYPTLTEETFTTINSNGDDGVDVAELTAAL